MGKVALNSENCDRREVRGVCDKDKILMKSFGYALFFLLNIVQQKYESLYLLQTCLHASALCIVRHVF